MAYSPTMGRWIQPEPSGATPYVDGLDLYKAFDDNPITFTDPDGLAAIDPRSAKVIAGLFSKLQPIATQAIITANITLAKTCKKVAIAISGARTLADQGKIPAKNTRATGTSAIKSYHIWGLAFDIGIFDSKGKYLSSDTASLKLIAPALKALGLEWGGDFKSIKDYPHFQYPVQNLGFATISALVSAYHTDIAKPKSPYAGMNPEQYIEKRFGVSASK